MTAPGSPWVATVATDAYTVGRLAIRAATALIVGEQLNKYLLVEPQLITQEFLRQARVTSMDELIRVLPGLGESELVWYDWMKPLLERNGYQVPAIGLWVEEALRNSEAQLREVISQQSQLIETIRELSTPVIPVHDRILVLPLIGSIDSRRSAQIMEALLMSVQQQQADQVIIDITGVPVVDTAVANHLIQAIRAVSLLGAQCVLVGIAPEVAQTVVQLGVDLSSLITRSNLQAGIAYALARQGLAITPRKQP
jgi:anti-anti-sigma factor